MPVKLKIAFLLCADTHVQSYSAQYCFLASLNVLAFRLTASPDDFTILNFAFTLELREKLVILIRAEFFPLMFQI